MTKNKIKGCICTTLYAFIYMLFGWIVFQNLRTGYLGGDESFTFAMIHHNFSSIIKLTAGDVHPFLYYFLARICILPFKDIFTQIIALKLLSAVPYLIILLIANITIKHKFSTKMSLIFMFMVVTAPVLNSNILISRMYGWTMLFTTVIFLLMTYIYEGFIKNSLPIFIEISLLTLADFYTQYDTILSVTLITIFFLILFLRSKINIKNFAISIVFSILLYLPWVKIMLHQTKYVSGTNYYASRFVFKIGTIYEYVKNIALDLFIVKPAYNIMPGRKAQLFILIFLLSILISLYLAHIHDWNIMIFGFLSPFIILFFGLLICMKTDHQILYPRYIISALGIFWLCVSDIIALILNKEHINRLFKCSLIGFIFVIGLMSYHSFYSNRVKPFITSLHQSQLMIKSIPNNSHVLFDNPSVMQQMSIYKPADKNYIIGSRCTNHINTINIWSNKGKKAMEGNAYKKVFKRIHLKNNLKSSKFRHNYFIKIPNNKEYRTSLSQSFYNKNKDKLIKLKSIKAPMSIFGRIILYKIK